MKRLLDLTISVLLIVSFFFPSLIICLLIKLDSKGPILNKSNRIGKNKKIFTMYKFRTMIIDAPVSHTNDLKEPQKYITRLGMKLRQYSIDEIPQIINIIIGDMSLVGPRPALDIQYDLIEKRDQKGINNIKPGLTGLAQVNGRDALNLDKKIEYDDLYKNRQSIILDIKILIKTILVVIKSKDIKH